jgi:hypothetical protein
VLFELAKRNKADVAETFRAITEATAVALDVERTSIWRLLPDGNAIVCDDNFVRAKVDTRPAKSCGRATTRAIFPPSPKTASSRRTRRAPTAAPAS